MPGAELLRQAIAHDDPGGRDMERLTKAYITSVVAGGGVALAVALSGASFADPSAWAAYSALAVLASLLKLRPARMEGTYSLSFLFILYGIVHFSLAEVLIAGCAATIAQSLFSTKVRPGMIRLLFNSANVVVSVCASFVVGRVWLASEVNQHLPSVIAAVAFTYFVVNTVLVSGVLALLNGKPLAEVCSQWYMWSFPYYLIGVTLVGLVPAPGQAVSGEAWLILLPLVYLVHFFLGLTDQHGSLKIFGNQSDERLPQEARVYLMIVLAAGLFALLVAATTWQSDSPGRFIVYLVMGVVASTLKIRLPRMRGTITPAFVLLLVAIAELSFSETVVMAVVVGLVQVLWRPARRPMLVQVLFNPACVALSAALAWSLCQIAPAWINHSVVGILLISTLVLYGSNTMLVAAMLALVDRKPLTGVWQRCSFWSFPYYIVGAAVAGLMTATSLAGDWPPSLLILPLMALVYVSYRVQLDQASAAEPVPN
jgi:hypothetical protein